MTTPLKPRVLGMKDSSRYAGVTVRTLDQYVKDGKLRKIKLGRKSLLLVEDLDKLLEAGIQQKESVK